MWGAVCWLLANNMPGQAELLSSLKTEIAGLFKKELKDALAVEFGSGSHRTAVAYVKANIF